MLVLLCISIVACCINVGPTSWYVLSAVWGLGIWYIRRQESHDLLRLSRYLLATFAVAIALLFYQTDVFSDDAHRYRWDGWVAVHGVDPYSAAPVDSSLASLAHATDHVRYPDMINNNTLKTIYPPAAQLVFSAIVRICGTEPLAFKLGWVALCMSMIALTIWLLWSDLHLLSRYLGVLISPIILLHGFMDIHVDIMMALAVMLALAMLRKGGRMALVGSSIYGISIAMKYLPILLLPVVVKHHTLEKRIAFQRALIIGSTIALLYIPFMHSDVFGSLGVFARAWQANSLLAWTGNQFVEPQLTRVVLMAIAGSVMLVVFVRWSGDMLWMSSLWVITLLVFSPVVHPWYLALSLILWVVAPSRATIVWATTMCVYAYTYENYKGNGVWYDHPVALAIEYLPVLVALGLDVTRGPLLLRDQHRMGLSPSVDR